MAKPGQKISGFGAQDLLPVVDAEAGHHRGRVVALVVFARAALARVAVGGGPKLVLDPLPEDGFGVVPMVAPVVVRMKAVVSDGDSNHVDDDDDG